MSAQKNARPGTTTIRAGLALAVVWIVIAVVVSAVEGYQLLMWPVVVGLVIAAIGFCRRVLAALENKPAALHD